MFNPKSEGEQQDAFPFMCMVGGSCALRTTGDMENIKSALDNQAPGIDKAEALRCPCCRQLPTMGRPYLLLAQAIVYVLPPNHVKRVTFVPRLLCTSCLPPALASSGVESQAVATYVAECEKAMFSGGLHPTHALWNELVMVGSLDSAKYVMGKILSEGYEAGVSLKDDIITVTGNEKIAAMEMKECANVKCGEYRFVVPGKDWKQGFRYCSGCVAVWYCGKECQTAHWKMHKVNCKVWKVAGSSATGDATV